MTARSSYCDYKRKEESQPDYVEFQLTDDRSYRNHVTSCAVRAFNIPEQVADDLFNSRKRIRCRPDQFARFLIWRSEGVSINQFQALGAKLVSEKSLPSVVDVRDH